MICSSSMRSLIGGVIVLAGAVVVSGTAIAINPAPPLPPNERQVYLVRQDFSNCTNDDVPNTDGPNVTGTVTAVRGSDGNTTLNIALTGTPDTTYHFYLKCVRQLGDIKTGDEGTGFATFTFPTNSAGNVYAFDSYPEGAPAGNKFQSAKVSFQ
jgi:hypothetical protein